MSEKNAKTLRKKLKLKLPIKADYKISKKVKKVVYWVDKITGETKAVPTEQVVIVNAAKFQYRSIKKIMINGAK